MEIKATIKLFISCLVILLILFLSGSILLAETSHTVEKGDTLFNISQRFNIGISELRKENNIKNNEIYLGEKLTIPDSDSGTSSGKEEASFETNGSFAASPPSNGEVVPTKSPYPYPHKSPYPYPDEERDDCQEFSGPKGPNISLDVTDADLRDVLSALALNLRVNIIPAYDEEISVTFKVDNVPAMEALELLSHTYDLTYIRQGNLIVVGPQEKLTDDFFNQIVLTRFNLKHVTSDTVNSLIDELGIPIQRIWVEENPRIVWAQGTPPALCKVKELLSAVDIPESEEFVPHIFLYTLKHTTTEYTLQRLDELVGGEDNLAGVRAITFDYPEFTQELLVITPRHLKSQVQDILGELDRPLKTIRVPVDSGESREGLEARRSLLSQLTGISEGNMNISHNISEDEESPHYIMWVEDTPENIRKVRNMIDSIDSP